MQLTGQLRDANEPSVENKILLSRLFITGHIHEHTPICVLIDIADAHGITYLKEDIDKPNFAQHILAFIHNNKSVDLNQLKDRHEWECVARFVNRNAIWPRDKLVEAYNFLIGFTNNDNLLAKIPENFDIGPQTPNNIHSINACILYKICTHYRLNVNSHTTINQMAFGIKMLREETESVIRRVKHFTETNINRTNLINILMLAHNEIEDPIPKISETKVNHNIVPKVEVSHDYLHAVYNNLTNPSALRSVIQPSTSPGAIALAALDYNIDISKSKDPLREYKVLRCSTRNDYQPVDPWLKYWYKLNPIMFDLSVTFNPLFPIEFYDLSRLHDMARIEGYSTREIAESNPYELLQIAHVSETFYQGELPSMSTRETPIDLNEIEEVPYGQLLCFGQAGLPMVPISMTELITLFERNQNFTSYRPNSVFSDIAINKLKQIAQSPSGPNPAICLSPETVRVRATLFNTISNIEIILRNNDEASRQLISTYRRSNPDVQQDIRDTLRKLLHVGMYMRGWNGSGPFPIEQALVSEQESLRIDTNVNRSIAEFNQMCQILETVGSHIQHLPLVLYKDDIYNISTDEDDGLTIKDRLRIVLKGDTINNMRSCIRLSSNWICSSAHKYMIMIGMEPPFEIYKLRRIS